MCIKEVVYAAIRKGENKEYVDTGTVSYLYEITKEHANKTDKLIPYFTKKHPVLRIGRFKLTEITE